MKNRAFKSVASIDQHSGSSNFHRRDKRLLSLALAFLIPMVVAYSSGAASLTHILTATGTTNWSTSTWTNGAPISAVGDVATFGGNAVTVLDVSGVSLGQLVKTTATNSWTISRGAGTSVTFDNTGGSANPFGSSEAFLGTTGNGGLVFNPDILIANTDLAIGSTATGAVTIGTAGVSAITASTSQNIIIKVASTAGVAINSSVGATGSALAILNSGTVAGATGGVGLNGPIGGAAGTGAPITITNTAAGTGAFTISGALNASVSSITQNSPTSMLVLSGSNLNYSGTTTLSSGILKLTGSTALGGNSAALVINSGTLDSNGQVLSTTNPVSANSDFTFAGSGNLTLSGPVSLGSTPGVRTITVSARTLTLNGSISDGVATGLTKAGAGTLALAGACNYSGTTTINAGILQIGSGGTTGSISPNSPIIDNGTLAFNRSNTMTQGVDFASAISGSGGISALAGTLVLNSVNTYSGTSAFGTATIQLNNASNGGLGSGLVTTNNTAISSLLANQSLSNNFNINGTTTISGSNNITINGSVTNTTGNRTLTNSLGSGVVLTLAGNLYLSESGTSRTFSLGGAGNTTISGVIADTNGTGNPGNLVIFNTGTTTLTGANTFSGAVSITAGFTKVSNIGLAGASSNLGTSGVINTGTTTTTGALVYTGVGETTDKVINLAGTTGGAILDQSGGGLLKFASSLTVTGSGAKTLTLQGSTAGAGEIAGVIPDGAAATSLTKAGTGTWTLSGVNTYSGLTTVSGGTLALSGSGTLGSGGLTLSGGSVDLGGSSQTVGAISITGASATANVLLNGSIKGASYAASNTTGNAVIGANLLANGSIGLSKSGAGILTLNGANTYTGATTITGGTLLFGKEVSLYNGSNASWTAANLVVSSGATAAFNVGGTGEFTESDIQSLVALGSASNGFKSGSFVGLDTTNASGGNFTYSNAITNPNSGANVLGVTKLGTGSLTLSGTSTYTGATNVTNGTVIVSGQLSASAMTISGGATLGGAGTVQAVTTTNGTIAPGNDSSTIGILNTGNLSATSSGAHLSMKLGATTAGIGAADAVNVVGTVNLTNADLLLSQITGFAPSGGDLFFLILNDGTDAVNGTFASLNGVNTTMTEGSTINFGGQQFQLTYQADFASDSFTGGNDVALMAVPEPSSVAMLLGGLGMLGFWQRARRFAPSRKS